MELSKPDRRLIAMAIGVIVIAALAITNTISGDAAIGAIIGILASMGVYQQQGKN